MVCASEPIFPYHQHHAGGQAGVFTSSMPKVLLVWQVVYEDDDLLAVSKPPFVSTAPRHRWEVCLL